jgi:Glycosyl transferase family 2
VLFLGSLTSRRAQFLARSAPVLSQWRCDLRLFEVRGPVRRSSDHFVTGPTKYELLANSRVLLNVHQGERDYFEWVRVMEAISNGCLVMTETSGGYAPLVAGEQFVEAGLGSLIGRVDAFLRDEDLRAEVAHRSYEYARKHLLFADIVDQLLRIVERRLPSPSPIASAFHAVPVQFRRQGRRKPVASSPNPLSPHDAALASALEGEQVMRSTIKDLILSEIQAVRTIEGLISAVASGSKCHSEIFETSTYAGTSPQVSVVLPLFNYARFVRHAIESVVASEGVVADLVIVDDHSNDDSLRVVRGAMADFDGFPIRLVAQSANRGPSPTRNTGFDHARADLVFVLDADNTIFPSGLHDLVNVIDEEGTAFSYGMIEKFGDSSDVVSYIPWDLERLTQQNYIDAMALVRKTIWREIGGYDENADRKGGWDDYDFWLHLAAEGYRGSFVANFIGRYRAHDSSWQSTVNLDTDTLMSFFKRKYPQLPWRPSELTT